jgi:hypothetical protein
MPGAVAAAGSSRREAMGKHFDDLSKAFASGVSRRQALMGALGGVGAAVAATVVPGRGRALAQTNAGFATQCANFCGVYCTQQATVVNGNLTYINHCRKQCIAEASMGQGACFGINGAPLYKLGCHSFVVNATNTGAQCPPGQVCCNNRCCDPELCFDLSTSAFSGSVFTNGLEPYFKPSYFGPTETAEICLGCPQTA